MTQPTTTEPPLTPRPPNYHSYLLRFWEERGQQTPVWRFSLEDPQTDQRHGFATLEALCNWLKDELEGTHSV